MTEASEAMRDYLMRGWQVERRVQAREAQLDTLRDRMTRVRSAAPKGPAGEIRGPRVDWTDAVDALADAEAVYLKEIAEMCAVKKAIRTQIEAVEPAHYRELLEYRYVYCLSWDDVADKLGYDRRYVFKLHNRALKALIEEADHGQGAV